MNISRVVMYVMAFVLLCTAVYAGWLAGMFDWQPQTVFYVCGGLSLLLLFVLSSHRSGGQVSTSFVFTRAVLGILAMGVSLFYSWNFVVGGAVGMAVATAAAFVLVTEGAKILFTSDVAYYSATGQGEKTVWTGFAVIVLFCLSIGATAWNLAVGSSKEMAAALQSDNQYKVLQARLETLRTELASARQDKSNCPANYFTNCINPAQARIDGLVAQEKNALTDLQNFKPVAGGHVFWERLAEMTGYAAVTLQSVFDFMRGLLLEIIGLVLIAQASAAARFARDDSSPQQIQASTLPQVELPALAGLNGYAVETLAKLESQQQLEEMRRKRRQSKRQNRREDAVLQRIKDLESKLNPAAEPSSPTEDNVEPENAIRTDDDTELRREPYQGKPIAAL